MTSINHSELIATTQTLLQSSQDEAFFDNHHHYTLLVDTLIDHNHLYYIDNAPIINDHDYDILFHLLKEFESLHPAYIRDDSPTQRLVGQRDEHTSP